MFGGCRMIVCCEQMLGSGGPAVAALCIVCNHITSHHTSAEPGGSQHGGALPARGVFAA